MKVTSNSLSANSGEGERRSINSELWHACAGPLVSLPPVGSLVVYFPQGHSEQVAASMQKDTDSIPSYPSLPSKLICVLHNVTLHADAETDEVYAQMTLQPVNKYDKEALLASDMGLKQNKQPAEFFCKTLTASDTSTHGGFSVPRRAAEKIFPPLDFSLQPPAQELVARDLHDVAWTFRHIYRGQPKRHLLTTGWSVFVSTKRLLAGDSVLFIRDEKSQLLLGIRRANRQQSALSSSVISSDSMHIGILAAAAHAAASNSPFTIFYNPRASPSEFVVPLAKYNKAMYTQASLGMRFRMMFETEESGVRRYMGTITGISDLDAVRWKGSQWRNLQVGWDESAAGERPTRVSIWEIEPVATPFYICPPPFFRPKFPNQTGIPDDGSDIENAFKRGIPWMGDDQSSIFPGLSLVQWMSMQQNPQLSAAQSGFLPSAVPSAALQNNLSTDDPSKILNFQQSHALAGPNIQFNTSKTSSQNQQVEVFQQSNLLWSQQQQQQLQQTLINSQQHQQKPLQQQHQNPLLQQQQQNPLPHQQQQQQQHQQNPLQPQQQQLLQHQQQQQQQQKHQLQQQQHDQQQLLRPALINSGTTAPTGITDQSLQKSVSYSQLHQLQLPTSSPQSQQNFHSSNPNTVQFSSLPQDLQFQRQVEQHETLSQRQLQQQQLQQLPVSQQQLQIQLLQKLQQQKQQQQMQQQQPLSRVSTHLQPEIQQQQQQVHQQSSQFQQQQHQLGSIANFSPNQSQHLSNHHLGQQKPPALMRAQSGLTDGEAPSCSTSPSTNNCQASAASFMNRTQQGTAMLIEDVVAQPSSNLVQELQSKSNIRVKHEPPNPKEPELAYRSAITDPLEVSSSTTSYCLDGGSLQNSFSLPNFCLDGEVQVDPPNNLLFGVNIEGLTPDTLLSRRFDSGKDLQNLLSSYGGTPRDMETEISTAAISSQSFGVPDMLFHPGSGEALVNDGGVLNSGLWANQTPQRMRTFTKVQKRGSVGRSIDITRYKAYDDLRHDLARMFGIEGQLEDSHRTEWKLVYVDHENDILLVGDDPWEEFVSCVHSIKILSSAEVQQLSLDGDLGNAQGNTQACSGSGSGNAWRGNYEDHSAAASFDR